MLDTLIMLAGLVALGYSFYISSGMFRAFRPFKGPWKWVYGLVSLFLLLTYFLFGMVLFSFITAFVARFYLLNVINTALGLFLLAGSFLVGFVMKLHVGQLNDEATEKAKKGTESLGESNERTEMKREIERLRNELDNAKKLNRLAVGRELKMIGLKNRIEELEKKH